MNATQLRQALRKTSDSADRARLHDALSNARDVALRARAMSLSDDCGANAQGGGGFQKGNTCASRKDAITQNLESSRKAVREATKINDDAMKTAETLYERDRVAGVETPEAKAARDVWNKSSYERMVKADVVREAENELKLLEGPIAKVKPQIEIADGIDVHPDTAHALLSSVMMKPWNDESEFWANRYKFKLVGADKETGRYTFKVDSVVPPKPATGEILDSVPQRDGYVYRGMSREEWDNTVATGKLQSTGYHNMDQDGLTFYGKASTAESYSTGFAPVAFASTPSKPGVVVEIPRKLVMSHEDLPDKIPGSEFAHRGAVDIKEIANVYEMHPNDFYSGTMDVIFEYGRVRPGSSDAFRGKDIVVVKRAPDMKFSDDCGANGPGGHGFQPGNTCAADGAGGGGVATKKPRASKAKTKAKPKNAGVDMSNKTAYKQTKSPNFKKWFKKSEVSDPGTLAPRGAFHGTQRPDRVGNIFDPKRATSGPMPFFTENAELASAYSERKRDTSLETPTSYAEWFKIKTDKGEFNIDDAWRNLSSAERVRLANVLPHVTNADENGDTTSTYRLGNSTEFGLSDKGHWDMYIRESRGNVLRAAREIWLDSGALFDSEAEFMDVLKAAGVKGASFHDPNALHSGVFKVYLSIQKALHTDMIPGVVYDRLVENGKGRPALIDPNEAADPWDKRAITGDEWVEKLIEDGANKTNYAWTTVPDWVTDTLREFGYDGIRDFSGKYAKPDPNIESSHVVWIPFDSWQVKSAIGNNGQWSRTNPDMSMADDMCGANAQGGGGFQRGNTCAKGSVRAFHGSNEKFDEFKAGEFGFHFGDEDAANMQGDAKEYELAIKNPLRLKDFGVWTPVKVLGAAHVKLKIPTEEIVKVRAEIDKLEKKLHDVLDQDDDMFANREAHYAWSKPVRELLKKYGHDGIVYKNEAEGFADSYIAFDNAQIKKVKPDMSMAEKPSREGANPWHWNNKPDVNEVGPVRLGQNPLTFQYVTTNAQTMPSAGELNRVTRQYRNAQEWARKNGKKLFLANDQSKGGRAWRTYLVSKGWLGGDGELRINVAMALSDSDSLDIAEAAARVAAPASKEQAEAGNYAKGHITVQGLPITIETAQGQKRFGWDQKMPHHYGYIKRTESEADGDHIDVFVGDDIESDKVFIVDQTNKSGGFDEHKCMVGFKTADDAEKAYVGAYEKGWDRYTAVTPISVDKFKAWIKDGDSSKPYAPAMKLSDDCGANAQGGGGFQPGNTCAAESGGASTGGSAMTPEQFNTHIKTIKSVPELYKALEAHRGKPNFSDYAQNMNDWRMELEPKANFGMTPDALWQDMFSTHPTLGPAMRRSPINVNGAKLHAEYHPDTAAAIARLEGNPATWVGAQPGAVVYAASNPTDPSKIIVKINHPKYQASREIDLTGRNVHNEWLSAAQNSQGGGLASKIVFDQVDGARAGGFKELITNGSKGFDKDGKEIYVGYKVWPKMGYAGPIGTSIDDAKVADMQARFGLTRESNIQDLYDKDGGPEWWATNGDSIDLIMDLADGSRSQQVFTSYRKRKEMK